VKKKPFGVLFLGIIGITIAVFFALLALAALWVKGKPISFGAILLVTWLLINSISLLKLKNWARISYICQMCLFLATGFILLSVLIHAISTGNTKNLSAANLSLFIVLFIPITSLIYLTRLKVKCTFTGEDPNVLLAKRGSFIKNLITGVYFRRAKEYFKTKDGKKLLKDLGVFLLVATLLSTIFVVTLNFYLKRSLSRASRVPYIYNFTADFYKNYNNQNFSYIYDTMASKELKAIATQEYFIKIIQGIYDKMGKVKNIRLFSYSYKNSRKLNKKRRVTYVKLEYLVENEKKEAINKFLILKEDDSWFLGDYRFTAKVSPRAKRYIDSVKQINFD